MQIGHVNSAPNETLESRCAVPVAVQIPIAELGDAAPSLLPQNVVEARLVQGSGFRVQGSGCRAWGFGFRVQGAGLKV